MRKGPEESATLFSVGIKKRGNDGNMWIIVKNKNGVKRWQKSLFKKSLFKKSLFKKKRTKKKRKKTPIQPDQWNPGPKGILSRLELVQRI